jgi:hypothetical protein
LIALLCCVFCKVETHFLYFSYRSLIAFPEEVGRFIGIALIYAIHQKKYGRPFDWRFAFTCGAAFGFIERIGIFTESSDNRNGIALVFSTIMGMVGHGLFTVLAFLAVHIRSWRTAALLFVICVVLHGAHNAIADWLFAFSGFDSGLLTQPWYFPVKTACRLLVFSILAAIAWWLAKQNDIPIWPKEKAAPAAV